jgi:hypothetical protein
MQAQFPLVALHRNTIGEPPVTRIFYLHFLIDSLSLRHEPKFAAAGGPGRERTAHDP